jgi:hypothetical protein
LNLEHHRVLTLAPSTTGGEDNSGWAHRPPPADTSLSFLLWAAGGKLERFCQTKVLPVPCGALAVIGVPAAPALQSRAMRISSAGGLAGQLSLGASNTPLPAPGEGVDYNQWEQRSET